MKKTRMAIVAGLLICALAAVFTFVACGPKEENAKLTFVAADKTNYDKEVSFTPDVEEGQTKYAYTYTLALNLYDGGNMSLDGTCVKKAEASTGGGPGGPGGGFPFSAQRNAAAEEVSEEETEPEEDLSGYKFQMKGKWVEEEGYGYTLTFDSQEDIPSGKVVHANYDTYTARHYFYANIAPKVNGKRVAATQIQFQAKDSQYMKKLASGYKTYEERNAAYSFYGNPSTGGGNASSVTMYLLNGGKVFMYSDRGSERTAIIDGSWAEDTAKHKITLTVGGKQYTSAYCDTAGKEGYRITYNSIDCYAPKASGVTWEDYSSVDFEGTSLYELNGSYESSGFMGTTTVRCTLTLTSKGLAIVRNASGTTLMSGEYTKTGDNITIDMGGDSVSVTKDGETYTVTLTITVVTQMGPNTSTNNYEVTFTGGAVGA